MNLYKRITETKKNKEKLKEENCCYIYAIRNSSA